MKSESEEDKYSVTIFKLTSGRFKDGDLSFFQTGIQGAHKLELNAVRRIRMVKVLCLQLHDAWVTVQRSSVTHSSRIICGCQPNRTEQA